MGYVFNDSTGRVAAIFLQGTPTPPAGFTFTLDPIDNEDIIDSKRDIGPNLIVKRDALKISGSNGVNLGTVGQVAIQKIDGTSFADLTGSGDDDPVAFKVENEGVFLDEDQKDLVQGAAAVKVAAPQVDDESRFLGFSPELQLLDTQIIFS